MNQIPGHPIEPCVIRRATILGFNVKMNTVKKVFIISTIAIIALTILGTILTVSLYNYPSNWIMSNIVASATMVAILTSLSTYFTLANAYNIAPPGLYRKFPIPAPIPPPIPAL